MAQSVEHVIGNDEVIGPNPISSSITKTPPNRAGFFVLDFQKALDKRSFTVYNLTVLLHRVQLRKRRAKNVNDR